MPHPLTLLLLPPVSGGNDDRLDAGVGEADTVSGEVSRQVLSVLPGGIHHGLQGVAVGKVLQDLGNVQLQAARVCAEAGLTVILHAVVESMMKDTPIFRVYLLLIL